MCHFPDDGSSYVNSGVVAMHSWCPTSLPTCLTRGGKTTIHLRRAFCIVCIISYALFLLEGNKCPSLRWHMVFYPYLYHARVPPESSRHHVLLDPSWFSQYNPNGYNSWAVYFPSRSKTWMAGRSCPGFSFNIASPQSLVIEWDQESKHPCYSITGQLFILLGHPSHGELYWIQ